jgi:hypothetical protein
VDALVRLLLLVAPALRRLLAIHREFYGEQLDTVVLAEVAEWCLVQGSEQDAVLELIDCLLQVGSIEVTNLLRTGFVEGIPSSADDEFLTRLPVHLRREVEADLGRR